MDGSTVLLESLWWTFLGLLALSGGLLAALVFVRWRKPAQEQLRAKVAHEVLAALSGNGNAQRVSAACGDDLSLAADVGLELAALVEGSTRSQLILLLDQLEVPALLIADLRDPRGVKREIAAEHLHLFSHTEVVSALKGALHDRDPGVRIAAARSLMSMGKAPPMRELLRLLEDGAALQSRALVALFKDLSTGNIAELADCLRGSVSADAALFVVEVLGNTRTAAAAQVLSRMATHPDPALRSAVIRALADNGEPASYPVLCKALSDIDWQVRLAAAEAAGRAQVTEAVDDLVRLLEENRWALQWQAAQSLCELGVAGHAALRRAAAEPRLQTARVAAMALAERYPEPDVRAATGA